MTFPNNRECQLDEKHATGQLQRQAATLMNAIESTSMQTDSVRTLCTSIAPFNKYNSATVSIVTMPVIFLRPSKVRGVHFEERVIVLTAGHQSTAGHQTELNAKLLTKKSAEGTNSRSHKLTGFCYLSQG